MSARRQEYLEYLRSPAWRATRQRYRDSRLTWRCHCCGDTDGHLDLHHKTYKRFGRERLSALVPLCRPCHMAVHDLVRHRGIGLWGATRVYRKRMGWRRRE